MKIIPVSSRSGAIVATGTILAGLYLFRGILSQLALALFLWFAVQSLVEAIRNRLPSAVAGVASAIVAIAVIAGLGFVGYEAASNARDMLVHKDLYESRLDHLLAQLYHSVRPDAPPPTMSALVQDLNVGAILRRLAGGFESIAAKTVFVLIYFAFMFPAAHTMPHKLDRIFPQDRAQVREIVTAIRLSMARYLRVQTLLAVAVGILTYVTLAAVGLRNPLLWGALAFFLNFIPTIGPIIAVAAPLIFSLVQFQSLMSVAMVGGGLIFWQSLIANVLQPRMMSESLNLSALVVLLSLAFWTLMWGIVGAVLSAPLTVMAMIIFAQFPRTEWVAILLSGDGDPGKRKARAQI